MRDQEIVGLYEAYQSIYYNVNEEVEQLDELNIGTIRSAIKKGNERTDDAINSGDVAGATISMTKVDRSKRALARKRGPGHTAGTRHSAFGSTAYQREEVETWVNALVEEGYDLSDYTWDDMYEMYINLDEEAPPIIKLRPPSPRLMQKAGPARVHNPNPKKVKKVIKETNLFNYLLEYLVAEGYADTNKAALAIMANMSEEWKQEIVDACELQEKLKPGTKRVSFSTGRDENHNQAMTERNPETGRQRGTSPMLKAMGAHARARTAQHNAEKSGDTQAAQRHKNRRDKIATVVYNKTNRIIDRADND